MHDMDYSVPLLMTTVSSMPQSTQIRAPMLDSHPSGSATGSMATAKTCAGQGSVRKRSRGRLREAGLPQGSGGHACDRAGKPRSGGTGGAEAKSLSNPPDALAQWTLRSRARGAPAAGLPGGLEGGRRVLVPLGSCPLCAAAGEQKRSRLWNRGGQAGTHGTP